MDWRTGTPLLQGQLKDSLYQLPFTHSASFSSFGVLNKSSASDFVGERASISLWHNRLGHPSSWIVDQVVSHFSLPPYLNKRATICEACQLGKSHDLPFVSKHLQSYCPLELIYTDLWVPSPVLSYQGYRYYVHFLDDFSKFVWIFPLRVKFDVMKVFIQF